MGEQGSEPACVAAARCVTLCQEKRRLALHIRQNDSCRECVTHPYQPETIACIHSPTSLHVLRAPRTAVRSPSYLLAGSLSPPPPQADALSDNVCSCPASHIGMASGDS